MDPRRIKRLRTYLTAHFSVIACLTSALVANSGDGNFFLPALVFTVVVSSLILVDILEVFHLGKLGSYVGMSVASLVALSALGLSVFHQKPEEVQFMAVASLLIYPQCILFFQKKGLRVFEQLAIFLLLQMIVAALINDNVVYGMLLAPIVILWVSSLFLVARYATLVEISPGIEQPLPLFYELVYQKFLKKMIRPTPKNSIVVTQPSIENSVLSSRKRRSLVLAVPLAVVALGFSGTLYYLLPRIETTALLGWELNQVGLPDEITPGKIGNFLLDPTPVMRLKLVDANGLPYQPVDPPYLRALVLDRYIERRGVYDSGRWIYQIPSRAIESYSGRASRPGCDLVRVEVALKKDFRKYVVAIPPIVRNPSSMVYKPLEMLFVESDENRDTRKRKILSYQFDTTAFAKREHLPITPDWDPADAHHNYSQIPELPEAERIRLEILKKANTSTENIYLVAKQLERHLKESGEYSYTLNLPRPVNEDIDPIEDFLVNQKTGLCQNYASALTAMLRQSGIPSRIVVGFVPVEWNRLGQHFIVRKMDAHAWVEARFSRQELLNTELERWLDRAPNYWVRLDPTPSSDANREIVESNQSLEYAEKLWEDYVSNADKIDQAGLYQNVDFSGSDMGEILKEKLQLFGLSISEGLFRKRDIHFAWPLALTVFMAGTFSVGLWQLIIWLPRLAPNLARKLGILKSRRTVVKQEFYARCIALLESLRIVRSDSETMQEYNDRAARDTRFANGTVQEGLLHHSLDFLRNCYHRLRFSAHEELDAETKLLIDQHLQSVENAVRSARAVKAPAD